MTTITGSYNYCIEQGKALEPLGYKIKSATKKEGLWVFKMGK